MPIGSFTSQPLGALVVCGIDHLIKERCRCKGYIRYCDDAAGLACTKGQAKRTLAVYDRESSKLGLVVKASAIISPIRHETYGKKKRRKRQRGGKRHADRLSRIQL